MCVVTSATIRSWRVRQSVLLIASFALYCTWQPWFAAILLTSIIANFLLGKWLQKNLTWLPLSVGVVFNLALLAAFKYLPPIAVHLTGFLHDFASVALPLGISFWTFQALSYLFDLYRGEELDPSFPEFALYMVFFPVTISGPVCRMPDMLPQFRRDELTSWANIGSGLRRIAIGVFMMQVGKLLGQGVLAGDGIVSGFDRTTLWSGPDVLCLAFGYGLQLFFDFAGYTHIAAGAAKALGITVPENFQRPFASTSPSAFWTRWHMSLSFWIRDYVFFPLAPLRREMWWRNLALALSMVVFGLWHKATWLFLIWGCYHGLLLVLHRQVQAAQRRLDWSPPEPLWTLISWISTATLISLGWIFFRANSLSQARVMVSSLVTPESYGTHLLSTSLYLLIAVVATGYALVVLVSDALERISSVEDSTRESSRILPALARWRWFWIPAIYAIALLFVLMITLTQEGGVGQMMYRSF